MTRRLALVGGLGVGATIHYYRALVAAHHAQGRTPRLLIAHADLDHVLSRVAARDDEGLAVYLAELIDRLANAGAEIAAISAVTPHVCAPILKRIVKLPVVDIVEAINAELRALKIGRVALVGARLVMESALFGALAAEAVAPRPNEADLIATAYARIAATGTADEATIAALRGVAERLVREEGAERVLLAGTDLSFVFDEANCGFPALDATRIHVAAIMRRLSSDAPPPGGLVAS